MKKTVWSLHYLNVTKRGYSNFTPLHECALANRGTVTQKAMKFLFNGTTQFITRYTTAYHGILIWS